jgi:hypothetical protein
VTRRSCEGERLRHATGFAPGHTIDRLRFQLEHPAAYGAVAGDPMLTALVLAPTPRAGGPGVATPPTPNGAKATLPSSAIGAPCVDPRSRDISAQHSDASQMPQPRFRFALPA